MFTDYKIFANLRSPQSRAFRRTHQFPRPILRQLRRMKRSRRKPAEVRSQRFCGQSSKLRQFPPPNQLREQRGAGNRRGASAAEKPHFANHSVFQNRRKAQDISTNRIAHFDLHSRPGKLSSIPWMLKMIQQRLAEHD
jgi:hypothetical protein